MKYRYLIIICILLVSSLVVTSCREELIAQEGDFVAVHYTGTLTDGTKFDSSHDRGQPLEFTIGAGQMIAGFDNTVKGMKVGDTKTVTLPPEEAYGSYNEELVLEFSLNELPEEMENPQVGDLITLTTPTGGMVQRPIVEVTDTHIIVDINHELAGKELTFEIEMVEITRGQF